MEPFSLQRTHLRRQRNVSSRGFTLLELLIVLAIIGIITAITVTSQSSFNRSLVLANTAYDFGLTIRYAQAYGTGSRVSGALSNTGYGIHIQNGVTGSFLLFADNYPAAGEPGACHTPPSGDVTAPDAHPGNCTYDQSGDTLISTYTFGNGITIKNFCVTVSSVPRCAGSGNLQALNIVFVRPSPEAYFGDKNGQITSASSACVELTSANGGERYISVNQSGEIQANAAPCIPTP